MSISKFIYRQKQKWKYHTSRNEVMKRIAEINRFSEVVKIKRDGFFFKQINFMLPVAGFDFVFAYGSFDLFLNNANYLNGKYSIETDKLIFSFGKIQIEITSGSELFIINEVFIEGCYNFRLPYPEKIIIVDVGMNVGLASLFFANHDQVEKVYAFEPFLPTFKLADCNLRRNTTVTKIYSYNFGLGNRDENLTIPYDPRNTGINSTLIDNHRVDGCSKENLEIKEAGNILRKIISENPGKKLIIKIDTEGAEYAIFDSLFAERLHESIIGFFIEWHFKGPGDLEQRLLGSGFKLNSFSLSKEAGLIYAFR